MGKTVEKVKKICLVCRKEFFILPCIDRAGNRKYCSDRCHRNRPTSYIKRLCLGCKKYFIVPKKTESKGARKYCSMKCTGVGWSMGQNPHIRKMKVERTCWNCEKLFLTIPSQIKKGSGRFCSTGCRNTFYGQSNETKKLLSQQRTVRWKNKEYKERQMSAMLKGLIKRPTSLEKQMIDIIKRNNLPYKYTGNGSFLIGYKNPDFVNINGEKKLIEVGNVYHHQNNYEEKRREHFAQYGWKSYIFIMDKLDEKLILKELLC